MRDGGQPVEQLEPRRVFSPLGAWALSLGCTVGWGSFVMPASTFLSAAGPMGTVIAFAAGSFAMLALAANYGYMASHIPGEGGVYSYARHIFGPNHAFVCSWCLVLAYAAAMVSNATALSLVVRSLFGGVLQVGFHYVVAGYDVYLGEVLSGLAAIALVGLFCIKSPKLTGRVEIALALGMVLGTAAILALLALDPLGSAVPVRPAFHPDIPPVNGVLMVLASVPWAYIGFESVSQVSGECAFHKRLYTRVMIVAVLCGTVMYLALNTVTAAFIPAGYDTWASYLADLPSQVGLAALPTFDAGYVMAGNLGLAVLGATAFCAVLSGVVGFYVAVTRLVWVMARDGALPRRFASLDASSRAPLAATLAVMWASFAIPFLGRNVLSWILDLMSLGALIAYVYTSLATCVVARREQNRVMHALGALGVLVSCACVLLLIVPLPGLDTSLSKETYIILIAWVALGVNFFTPTVMR